MSHYSRALMLLRLTERERGLLLDHCRQWTEVSLPDSIQPRPGRWQLLKGWAWLSLLLDGR